MAQWWYFNSVGLNPICGFKIVIFYNKGFSVFQEEVQILLWQNLLHMERGPQYSGKWKEKGIKYYTLYILKKLSEDMYINICMKKDLEGPTIFAWQHDSRK